MKILHRFEYFCRVQNYRWEQRITQATLAKALGISRQALSAIEQSKAEPSLRLAMHIAKYFRVPPEDLFVYREKRL